MLPRIQLKINVLILLLSLLTRDEDMEEKELRLATADNCFVQEFGRASELREMIDDGKKIRCSISIQSYNPQGQTSWHVSKPWYHWDNIPCFLSNSGKKRILKLRGFFLIVMSYGSGQISKVNLHTAQTIYHLWKNSWSFFSFLVYKSAGLN